jgi:hypothetical protein
VLVAILLIGVIVGAAFDFFWNIVASKQRLTMASARVSEVTTLEDTLGQALFAAEAGTAQATFSGSAEWLGVPCRVVAAGATGDARPYRRFIKISFNSEAHTLDAAWDSASASPMVRGVGSCAIRYFDGRAWAGEFDAGKSGRLPAVVEVAITWVRKEESKLTSDGTSPADVVLTLRVPDSDAEEGDVRAGGAS